MHDRSPSSPDGGTGASAARDYLVAADDRTGAAEVAAELARPGAPVTLTSHALPDGSGVVDLGTRGRPASDAAAAVAALPTATWRAHKMDSTLRGNWPEELRAYGTRVLVVPAWPAMGRTCVDGVVRVHGREVGAVADRLPEVVHLGNSDALAAWLVAGTGIAAVDVPDGATLHAVAVLSAPHHVLVAGPAGPIGACFRSRAGAALPAHATPSPRPAFREPVLVVVGSASPEAATQVARLRAAAPHVRVLAAPPAAGDLHPEVAHQLAEEARPLLHRAGTVVIVGGDTAAALLGPAPRLVGGYAAPGMPWSVDADGGGPVVVTKAGSFGGPDALVDLLLDPSVGQTA